MNEAAREYVQQLYRDAGEPGVRQVAASAGLSHTTVNDCVRDRRDVSLDRMRPVVAALGGDVAHLERIWEGPHKTFGPRDRPAAQVELLQLILEEIRGLREDLKGGES